MKFKMSKWNNHLKKKWENASDMIGWFPVCTKSELNKKQRNETMIYCVCIII